VPPCSNRWTPADYFDVHHSAAADTLDKVDPENLKRTVAALATMAFVIADRDETWDGAATTVAP
jgi:carboxypeptidase Q